MSESPCRRVAAVLLAGTASFGLSAVPAHAAAQPATPVASLTSLTPAASVASVASLAPGAAAMPASETKAARVDRAGGTPWWIPSWQAQDALACRVTTGSGTWGLQAWPAAVRARVGAQFGVSVIGGYRPGNGSSDHHSGNAIDIMVRGDRGHEIARWFQDNSGPLNVKYLIWEQRYWHPGMSTWRPMADRGSETANHYDHVHVSFRPGWGSCPGW